ncbi:hypothetical protein L2K70_11660 [Nocardioides KLBMP 9356]|uniref:Ig-like domain repeat protein n=1 Tax=Nocardioides potassii TaxID=2911371 RepID=A0ABS9HDE8_9ACTN|nr:hypothetical protein [Nocardioides potassii]MCF6378260.1 hypothetical protein [Nocardioides potassii]
MSRIASPRAARRVRVVLAIVVGLLTALVGALTSAAPAAPSAPVVIVIDRVAGVAVPTGVPSSAAPSALVQAGGRITITVSFLDASGAPASFTKDTTLRISSSVGSLSQATGIAPKGKTTVDITTSVTKAVNKVVLGVDAGTGPKAPTGGTSAPFDVLTDISAPLTATNGAAFSAGFGGEGGCTQATASQPVCQVVVLPRGAGSQVVLSSGVCDTDASSTYAPCFVGVGGRVDGAVLQALFAEPTQEYTTASPATVIVKCDKTLCGGGAVSDLTVAWSLAGNGNLTDALPCPAKNTMAAAATPCVDYVQSKRDGSGDTHLYLLTDRDIRTGIG